MVQLISSCKKCNNSAM